MNSRLSRFNIPGGVIRPAGGANALSAESQVMQPPSPQFRFRLFLPVLCMAAAGCGVKPTRIHRDHFGSVTSVAWSPDGARIISGGSDGRVIIRDAATGGAIQILEDHDDGVHAAVLSPDGTLLATGSADGRVLVYAFATAERVTEIAQHRDEVRALAWMPEGGRIFSAGDDNRVFISDAKDGGAIREFAEHNHEVRALLILPGEAGKPRVVSADTEARTLVWDPETGEIEARLEGLWGPSMAMVTGPGGAIFATGDLGGQVILWNSADLSKIRAAQLHHELKIEALAISPDGRRIACAGADGVTVVADMETLEVTDRLRAPREALLALSFSPDGRELLTGGSDHWIRIYPAP